MPVMSVKRAFSVWREKLKCETVKCFGKYFCMEPCKECALKK